MESYIAPFLLAAFISFFATPLVRKLAFKVGAVDIPKDDRRVHKEPMPLIGGLAIFIAVVIVTLVFLPLDREIISILLGASFIVVAGIIDDLRELKPKTKFTLQIIAGLILILGGIKVEFVTNPFAINSSLLHLSWLSIPITLFWVVGITNTLNFIDGLDGLAGGISSIYFLTIGIIAVIQQKTGLDFVLTFTMLGSTLGFLVHNFYPASIFMGDSGSMFLGFIISVIALLGFKNVTMTSLIVPLLILAIPILDVIFAILRRFIKGQSISAPDKYHIHHQLLKRNLSQQTVVLIIYVINVLFALASIVYILKSSVGYIIYGLLIIIVLTFILKTDVIISHEDLKEKIVNGLKFRKNK